jgi:hypothetical protein
MSKPLIPLFISSAKAPTKALSSSLLTIITTKGSRKNKFTFSTVEAPAWRGAKAQDYQDISSFRNAARQDASAL